MEIINKFCNGGNVLKNYRFLVKLQIVVYFDKSLEPLELEG